MGLQCFKATPYKTYSTYFEAENPAMLKEQWPPVKLFKLKKIFEANALTIEGYRQKMLSFEAFIGLLPQLAQEKYSAYTEVHKRRLFELFDRQGIGLLNWSSFFAGYSFCQYGSEQLLSVLMFSLFDYDLKLRLTRLQLTQLLTLNAKYIREDGSLQLDEESALEGLLGQQGSLSVQQWLLKAEMYFQFGQFRKMLTVWAQQEVQRELAQRFNELNELFDEQRGKYIGYLVNYKWFQSWKTHVHKQYDIQVNGFSNNLTYNRTMKTLRTQKSFKTKKTIRSLKSAKSIKTSKSIHSLKSLKKTAENPRLRQIPYEHGQDQHSIQYNLVYSNIGDQPAEIYNNLLQGEFNQILIPQLIQNIHYVIVSEEVWRRLKLIYGAYPEFRRTGEKAIQIYPKNFKIYTRFHKGRINFEEEKICEFSNSSPLNILIAKALEIQLSNLNQYKVFFKTCSMFRWQQLPNLSIRTAQISSEQIVFLAVVAEDQAAAFMQVNCCPAQGPLDIHLGDEFIYLDPVQRIQRRAVFMGKSKNRMIIHFRNSSYIYDLCIDRELFLQRCLMSRRSTQNARTRVKIEELQLVGLPNAKGLGFINSVLLSLLSNEDMSRLVTTYYREQPRNIVQHLAVIAHMLTNTYQARAVIVADLVRRYFYEFTNFQFTMCQPFIQCFFEQLHQRFRELKFVSFENPVNDYMIEIELKIECSHCLLQTLTNNACFSLTLPIPSQETKDYQIIYVPYAYSLRAVQLRKYAFSLPKGACFKQYKQAFQRTADLNNPYYLIAEVHGNNIIKNYLNAKDQASLEDLLLRQDDVIFAYQLCFRVDNFVQDHYSNDPPKLKNLRVGQMLDFQKEKAPKANSSKKKVKMEVKDIKDSKQSKEGKDARSWNFGKITKIDIEPYTHKWLIEVEHRQNRVQIVSTSVNPQKVNIASFPTRSYLYSQQFHLRLLNRFYNQVSCEMQLCNIPLVVMVAGWMRLREVELFVYQQVRQLIADPFKFKLSEGGYQQEDGQSKISKKDKMKKFKEYLYNHAKPYRLVFTDHEGRCSVCCKIQKSHVQDSQADFTCEGCELDPQTPVFWQIRPYQARLCVDWITLDSFVKPEIVQHSSYAATKAARKNSVQSVTQCLKQRLKLISEAEQCSCSYPGFKRMFCDQKVTNVPERLVVFNELTQLMFDRLVQQEQNYKRINRKYIHFQLQQMEFHGETYQLVAATSIQGSQVDAKYLTYLRDKNHWLQYNGEHVKVVKKNVVQKICALLLQYRRIIKNDKRINAIRQ